MAIVSAEGFATPFHGESYPTFGGRIPALRSFYIGHDVGDSDPHDHEIVHLQVMVGGPSHDLSPNVNFPAAAIPDGRLEVALQDSGADDEIFYRVSHSILTLPGARRYQIRQVGNVGEVVRRLPSEVFAGSSQASGAPLLALVGFRLLFDGNRDHELDRIGIWFRDDELHVVVQDQNTSNTGDNYSFLVDFVAIPRMPGIEMSRGILRGTAADGERVPFPTPSRTHLLLTGWALNFKKGDHEIRDMGVDRQGDDFVIFYADKNRDDPFDWRVEWAHIGPTLAAQA